jgi:hypothetical protein
MTTKPKDGGAAYPWQVEVERGNVRPDGTTADKLERHIFPGMTLRDWFAGQALAGLCSRQSDPGMKHRVTTAYQYADAMLAARVEEGEKE